MALSMIVRVSARDRFCHRVKFLSELETESQRPERVGVVMSCCNDWFKNINLAL